LEKGTLAAVENDPAPPSFSLSSSSLPLFHCSPLVVIQAAQQAIEGRTLNQAVDVDFQGERKREREKVKEGERA